MSDLSILGYGDSRTLQKKRRDILEGAKDLFIKKGIEQTSMQMIADSASITRRSLYNYYESKDLIAVDIQILNLTEISFFSSWDYRKWSDWSRGISEAFTSNLEKALGPYRSHYLYINRFDTYFSKGYPDRKYVDFMQSEISRMLGDSFDRIDTSVNVRIWSVLSLLMAYFQRIVRRSLRYKVDTPSVRDESALICNLAGLMVNKK